MLMLSTRSAAYGAGMLLFTLATVLGFDEVAGISMLFVEHAAFCYGVR